MSYINKQAGGYYFTMDANNIIVMAGYNVGAVRSPYPIYQTPPTRNRFGFMLEMAFGAGTLIPPSAEWPNILDDDDQVIGTGISLTNMDNNHVFAQSQYIYNSEFAQLVGFQPGGTQVNESRVLAKTLIKYLNLLYLVPVFLAGDPVLALAQYMASVTAFEIRDNYVTTGFPGVLTFGDANEVIRYFLTTEEERRAFVMNYVHPTLRLRGNPVTLEKSAIDYLVLDDVSGITVNVDVTVSTIT